MSAAFSSQSKTMDLNANGGMEDSGIDSDPKTNTRAEDDNVFGGSDSSSCSSNGNHNQRQSVALKSTTKQLQKKLEARIEQAKRIQRNSSHLEYTKLPDNESDAGGPSGNISLIPIQRLPIPQKRKKHSNALIDFLHSDSESEDEMTLFASREEKSKHKQDLTDTFSIEELSEEGSEDSLHLGAAPMDHPHTRTYMPSGCFSSCHCRIL
ncbi:uncharacterized protein LOC106646121 [Copidosoma floridanum]|uniref:uncharacterized protein LOC106646121 n=1 Tax=Copidosoma floridanum TaxID=29053 RepID=UPI000C6F93FD|nr:uncharacterized protein LOC106646121 [Copidosoma floridanum]